MVYFLMLYLSISVITNLKFTAPYIIKNMRAKQFILKKCFELRRWLSFPVRSLEDFTSNSADLQSWKESTKL